MKTQDDIFQEQREREENKTRLDRIAERHIGEDWEGAPTYSTDKVVNDGLTKFFDQIIANRNAKPIHAKIDDIELMVSLGGTFSDLHNLFDIEPSGTGTLERNEWLEVVALQAHKLCIELATKTKERLQNERNERKRNQTT